MITRRSTRLSALAKIWADFVAANEVVSIAELNLGGILAVGAFALGVLAAMTFIEPVQRWTGFDQPWMAATLIVTALASSYAGARLWHRAPWRDIALAFDTAFYCAFVGALMVHTTSPIRYVFGLIYSQVAADYGRRVPFNWITFLGVTLVPLALAICVQPDFGLLVLVLFGAMMYAFTAISSAERIRLRKQNSQLESAFNAADRVASNSLDIALAATVAEMGGFVHHLRNALTPVTNHLRFLGQSESLVEDDRIAVESAQRSAARSVELLEKLVASIKVRSALIDIAFPLDETLRRLSTEASADPRHAVRLSEPVPEFDVRGNPEHLRLALENLLRNAFEAGARTVTLKASLGSGGQSATLCVMDDGRGIPPVIREALLHKPVSHGKQSGHGFGIYLSRRLVELLGGRLSLEQTGPEGTTFQLWLPGHCRMPADLGKRAG